MFDMVKIEKITKIKELGLFSDYRWDDTLPSFGKYNLIYGWNGSGKTTLSRLFDLIGHREQVQCQGVSYEVKTDEDDNKTYNHKDSFDHPICVFNQDYVESNVNVKTGKASLIFILGEKNKDLADQVEKGEVEIADLTKQKEGKEAERKREEKEKGDKFSAVAKVIKAYTKHPYNKTSAEKDFDDLSEKSTLEDLELEKKEMILRQEQKEQIQDIEISASLDLSGLCREVASLCEKSVEVKVLEKLNKNPIISGWVEKGLQIHQRGGVCEFCNSNISDERMDSLLDHFNEADKELKKDIDEKISEIENIRREVSAIRIPNKAEFYTDLQQGFSSKEQEYNKEKETFCNTLSLMVKVLEEKKQKTTESVPFLKKQEDNLKSANASIREVVGEHNRRTSSFNEEREKAFTSLKNHYLSEIWDEVKNLESSINSAEKEVSNLCERIRALKKCVEESKGKINPEDVACGELNKYLQSFLGRDEIRFEVVPGEGYQLKRNGSMAENMSESEKTAVAFMHFVVHLKDQGFNLENGIVVIDDPVSSLDANSLYKAFSFLENSMKGAGQVFVLTHNFQFLRLILNSMKYRKQEENCYMIKNRTLGADKREAFIAEIDPALKKYETEYQYLFKVLHEFASQGMVEGVSFVYHIPNIARKFLETFLMNMQPGEEGVLKRLEKVDFDKEKKDAIYKFTNDQSHSTGDDFDPALVPGAQDVVKDLLEMVEQINEQHFKSLCELLVVNKE